MAGGAVRRPSVVITAACCHASDDFALASAFFVASAQAVRQLVIIEEAQFAQRVEGVVLGPNDEPIADIIVTDRNEDGAAVLRSTKSDCKGHFHFPTQQGKTQYCVRFDHPLGNTLQLTLKLDRHAPERGITAKPQIGKSLGGIVSVITCGC